MNRIARTVGLAVAAPLAAGCASHIQSADSLFGIITPYRIEIQQGNVLTQELLERVKPGMTRLQVRDAIGSPMLADIFHADRWDYPFAIRRQGAAPQRRNVTLHFEGDKLARIEAPELPTENAFVASISRRQKFDEPKLSLTDAERAALPVPPARPAPAAEAVGPARSYPPLEPTTPR